MEEASKFNSFESLVLNDLGIRFLKEIAKWSYFLSIVGFVFLVLIIVGGVFFGSLMSEISNASAYQYDAFNTGVSLWTSIAYVIIAVIYFFPIYYLFNFSKKMKLALKNKNPEVLASAFSNLKSHYKFLGIFTITLLSIYTLVLVGTLINGASAF